MNRARNTTNGTQMNGNTNNNRVNNNTNGMNNNAGGMNGNRVGGMQGQALRGNLAEQIRALCFVKKELELYLDTHPNCPTALDYFYRTVEELNRLTEEYENTVGPITSGGVVSTDEWTWVKQPWPWQRAGDYMQPREER